MNAQHLAVVSRCGKRREWVRWCLTRSPCSESYGTFHRSRVRCHLSFNSKVTIACGDLTAKRTVVTVWCAKTLFELQVVKCTREQPNAQSLVAETWLWRWNRIVESFAKGSVGYVRALDKFLCLCTRDFPACLLGENYCPLFHVPTWKTNSRESSITDTLVQSSHQ